MAVLIETESHGRFFRPTPIISKCLDDGTYRTLHVLRRLCCRVASR